MFAVYIFVLALTATDGSPPAPGSDLTGIKCIVSGKAANRDCWCNHLQGRLYFDCNASKLKYEANKLKFATKANHQLVVSGQYAQANCPIRHTAVTESTAAKTTVAGVVLRFCCPHCLQAFDAQADPSKRIELVFGSSQFGKTFVTAAEENSRQ